MNNLTHLSDAELLGLRDLFLQRSGGLGYMGEKRKQLVEQFGYDCKNGAHLIRLLRMGVEFLTEGRLYVKRHDAQQLLAIKRGEWTLEMVQVEAERLFVLAEQAYVNSSLPDGIDMEKVNALCVEIVRMHLGL